jgi:hypothetical protein
MCVQVEFEVVAADDVQKLGPGRLVIEPQAFVLTEQVVVDDPKGGHVERILIQHTDAPCEGLARCVKMHCLVAEDDFAAVGRLVARQDLHQGALAGPILPQDAIDLSLFEAQTNAVVGLYKPKMFANVPQFNAHRRFDREAVMVLRHPPGTPA